MLQVETPRIIGLVVEKMREWQKRPIRRWYPILFLDEVFLKAQRDTVASEVVTLSWVSMVKGIGRYWGSGPREVLPRAPCHGRKSSSL